MTAGQGCALVEGCQEHGIQLFHLHLICEVVVFLKQLPLLWRHLVPQFVVGSFLLELAQFASGLLAVELVSVVNYVVK